MLKVSTSLLHIDPWIWNRFSTAIIIGYGLLLLFPQLWDRIKSRFQSKTSSTTFKKEKKTGFVADVLLGASLGPLFASCSPTYALIIGTILPQNLWMGTLSILMYILGFGAVLFFIIYFGKEAIKKLSRYANPNGIFKKVIGVLFILTGIGICTGGFKYLESKLVEAGIGSSILNIEKNALQQIK
ncbi:MAG: sulfite exporter TauE/SafE family protein [bacterium]|nr:sulfite exporter TauE/SafE family protein [bacterium]